MYQNKEGFRKIVKKYAKVTNHSIGWFRRNQATSVLHRAAGVVHELIVMLSHCWTAFKANAMADGTSPTDVWTPPASFSRKTTKYWVEPGNISRLKVFVLKHVPILEMNPSRKVELDFEQQQLSQTHNFISSVYLDSDDFQSYHSRIRQDEGAELFRIRWYGGQIDEDTKRRTSEVNHVKHLPGDPGGTAGAVPTPSTADKFLFIERKTHHEKWYGPNPSIKERFMLKRKRIGAFMDGTMNVRQELETMVEKGHLKPEQLESSIKLAQGYQETVMTQNMTPKVRSSCHRTAFQEKTNNQVRLSLDFPLYLFKDVADDIKKFWGNLDSPIALNPFPYGVLEIKTSADDPPEWVNELLATGWIHNVHKFSKYQHSIATNFPEHLEILPYWIKSISDSDSSRFDDDSGQDCPPTVRTLMLGEKWPESVEPRSVTRGQPSATSLADTVLTKAAATQDHALNSTNSSPASSDATLSVAQNTAPAGGSHAIVDNPTARSSDHTKVQIDTILVAPVIPPTLIKTTPTLIKTTQPPTVAETGRKRKALIGWSLLRRAVRPAGQPIVQNRLQSSDDTTGPRSASQMYLMPTKQKKMKIEPKTFFANERTFIQWLGAALFLVTLASAMMATGHTGKVMGTMFFPVGIFFLLYALRVYHWRLKLIKNRTEGARFDDPYGPTILTIGVLISLAAVITFVWTDVADDEAASSTSAAAWDSVMVEGATCDQLDQYACNAPPASTTHPSMALQTPWAPGCMATLARRTRSADMIFAAVDAIDAVDVSKKHVSTFRGCMDVSITSAAPKVDYELPVRRTYCIRGSGDSSGASCRTVDIEEASGTIVATESTWGSAFGNSTALSLCGLRGMAAAGSTQYRLTKGIATNASDLVTEVVGANATLQLLNSSHGMRYQHDVLIAGTPAKLSLLVEYASEPDRSVARNPISSQLWLEFMSTPSLTSHHNANMLMQFFSFLENEAKAKSGCR